jgi:F0F1-type ATP synthase assembly protein I
MSRMIAALRLIGVGFFIGGAIVMGVLVGRWLDIRFNTSPILVIIGLLLGIAIAFYGVYQMLLPLVKNKRNEENG